MDSDRVPLEDALEMCGVGGHIPRCGEVSVRPKPKIISEVVLRPPNIQTDQQQPADPLDVVRNYVRQCQEKQARDEAILTAKEAKEEEQQAQWIDQEFLPFEQQEFKKEAGKRRRFQPEESCAWAPASVSEVRTV